MRVPKKNCHPDRSVAKWRDLLFFQPATKLTGSTSPPFVIPSGHGPQADRGPPKEMKNTFSPATDLHGSVALPFVIPSAAEGSAVPRTSRGNVFRQSEAEALP